EVDRTGATHGNIAQGLGVALGEDAYRAVAQLGFPEQQRRQRVADLAVAAVLDGRNVQAIDHAAHAVDRGGEPQRALAGGDALDFAFEHDRARFEVHPDRMAVEVDARLVFECRAHLLHDGFVRVRHRTLLRRLWSAPS